MTQVRKAIGSLNGIFWNPKITKRRKYNIHNAVVKNISTHGGALTSENE
jgi:hypothetical protein